MPQLESGRHAGISPKRLFRMIEEAEQGRFVHRLMAVREAKQLLRHLEVIELRPVASGEGVKLCEGSLETDTPFEEFLTGVTLDRLDDLAHLWTPEETDQMRRIMWEPRFVEHRNLLLDEVSRRQQGILAHGAFLPRLLAMWWHAGVHPAQEEGWEGDEDGELPEWDDCDLLSAVTSLAFRLDPADSSLDDEARRAVEMSRAMLDVILGHYPDIDQAMRGMPGADARAMAGGLRSRALLDSLPEERRQWLHGQLREVAGWICGAFDAADLRRIDPAAASIAALAWVSADPVADSETGQDA